MIASVGQILIYAAFLLVLITWGFVIKRSNLSERFTKAFALSHLVSVIGVLCSLYYLIFTNQFQYHYVWQHTSLSTPFWFKVSCLWEGQEGSFLLWNFWNALIIVVLSFSKNKVVKKGLLFLIPVQLVLLTMVMGIKFPSSSLSIGSSPFSLLKAHIQSEVYALNPDFIPTDGTGMNALLQNYWMVIHPPIIFLGFAVSSVPFAICLGALLKKETIADWVKPTMPWMLAAVFFIGLGMIMGAYWAYETLNFGGYWNWDPVENAIYIPWLILLAALHLMVVYTKKQKALKPLVLLTIAGFLLVIYSTFLTRSGILGDSSVHSFTDLGLSGQLLFFLLGFLLLSVVVYIRSLRFFPVVETAQPRVNNFEFWLLVGALVLALSAFQVLIPTSFPVINALGQSLGFQLKLAPPADQVSYYTDIQLWFSLLLMLLTVVAQLLYRKKQFLSDTLDTFFTPIIITTLLVSTSLVWFGFKNAEYTLLLLVGVFSAVMNIKIFMKQREFVQKSGGALAHVGFVILVLGVLFSQGYKKVLTETTQFENEMNRAGNVLLVKDKPIKINDYEVVYEQAFFKTASGSRIEKTAVAPTFQPGVLQVKQPLFVDGKHYEKDDALTLDVENSYYRVSFISEKANFSIEPRIQYNSQMGVVASPDISTGLYSDIYTHVSNFPDPNQLPDWSKAHQLTLSMGDSVVIGAKSLVLQSVNKLNYDDKSTVALKAHVILKTADTSYRMQPVLLRKEGVTQVVAGEIPEDGSQLVFHGFNPENETYHFSYLSSPLDWITIKSIRFPLINLVWLGAMLMLIGISLSFVYRLQTVQIKYLFVKPISIKTYALGRSLVQFIKS